MVDFGCGVGVAQGIVGVVEVRRTQGTRQLEV